MKDLTFLISETRISLVLSVILISAVFVGCNKKCCLDPNAINYDPQAQIDDNSCSYADFQRAEMLENLCENYIIPGYNNYNLQTSSLKDIVTTFSNDRTIENLLAVRTQWMEALLAWQDVSFIDFGPA